MLFLALTLTFGFTAAVFNEEIHDKFVTIERNDFIEYFNNQPLSYKIKNYPFLEGRVLANVKTNSNSTVPKKARLLRRRVNLPENFDARIKWPHCETINDVNNQGICGSCWTFGSANTASDRLCIHNNVTVRLSEMDFECMDDNEHICDGGIPEFAFQFWIDKGLVTRECKPYYIRRYEGGCTQKCQDRRINYNKDKYYGKEVYSINIDEEAIKVELFENGPVQASFYVYEDFVKYASGIYEHMFGFFLGSHSVRVIGYGVEDGVKFWLAANSWGKEWGDSGLFRIKQFQRELSFETDMFGAIPMK